MSLKSIQAKRPKITFGLPFQLRNEFKAACDLEGIDMTSVLIRYMKKYVEDKKDNLANIRSEYSGCYIGEESFGLGEDPRTT